MWFVIALVIGVGLAWLVMFMRSRNIQVTWYEWLLGIVGLLLMLFTVQNFVTAFSELEPQAAWLFWLVLGLPAAILLVVAWQLVARHNRTA